MPLDTRIPLGIQALQLPDPAVREEQRARAQARQTQAEDRQLALDEKRREAETERQLRELFAGQTPPTPQAITQLVGPERAANIVKGMAALQADPRASFDATQKIVRDVLQGMAALPEGLRAEYYPTVRQGLIQRGVINDGDAPAQYDPQWFATTVNYGKAPAEAKPQGLMNVGPGAVIFDPETRQPVYTAPQTPSAAASGGFTLSPGARRYDAQGNVIASAPAAAGGGNNDTELVNAVIANPALWSSLTPTVKTRIGAKLAAQGFDKWQGTPGAKPSNGMEKSALGFFNRAKQADTDLKAIEGDIAKMGLGGQTRMAVAPNWLQSQTGQLYQQAQRAFTEARLRKDSGAAIPETEFANDRRTYFVQPGDSAATIAQKERARASVLASMSFQSGAALGEFYGDDAAGMIDDYRARSRGGARPAPPAVGEKTNPFKK